MCCMSGSSSTALCARNAHITLYDVTTWSWVNLVNPVISVATVLSFSFDFVLGNLLPEIVLAVTQAVFTANTIADKSTI